MYQPRVVYVFQDYKTQETMMVDEDNATQRDQQQEKFNNLKDEA